MFQVEQMSPATKRQILEKPGAVEVEGDHVGPLIAC